MPSIESRRLAHLRERLKSSGAAGRRNEPLAAMIWVTIAMVLFAGLGAFAKQAALLGLDPFQVVFFRNLFCVILMLPLLLWRGPSLWQSQQFGLYGLRASISFLSMSAWFYAVAAIPLAEVMAIGFLAPLFGTLFAVLFLGEIVRRRRWSALLVGFMGAIIILQPGGTPMGTGQLCALASAVSSGMLGPLVKQLTRKDDADRIVFLTNVFLVPLSLMLALPVWQWPAAHIYPYLIGMALCAVVGHVALVRGFASTDASLVFTFEFSRLPFAAAIGWYFFGEAIGLATWLGAGIIFASAAYITQREAQLRKEASKVRARLVSDPLALTPLRLPFN